MPAEVKSVNKADINTPPFSRDQMPLDIMGLLFFAYRDFTGDADVILSESDFGRAHHRVLYFVNLKPGMAVADLLDILKITKQSLARVLRQLIDNGYIEQKPGETDRRQRLLYATPLGRAFWEQLSESQTNRINAALANLPEGSRDVVRRFFVEMVEERDRTTLDRLNLTQGL